MNEFYTNMPAGQAQAMALVHATIYAPFPPPPLGLNQTVPGTAPGGPAAPRRTPPFGRIPWTPPSPLSLQRPRSGQWKMDYGSTRGMGATAADSSAYLDSNGDPATLSTSQQPSLLDSLNTTLINTSTAAGDVSQAVGVFAQSSAQVANALGNTVSMALYIALGLGAFVIYKESQEQHGREQLIESGTKISQTALGGAKKK